jgi:hypothetical protein
MTMQGYMNELDGKKGLCPRIIRTYLSTSGFTGGEEAKRLANKQLEGSPAAA